MTLIDVCLSGHGADSDSTGSNPDEQQQATGYSDMSHESYRHFSDSTPKSVSSTGSSGDWTQIANILDAMTPGRIDYISESDIEDTLTEDAQIMKRLQRQ